MFAKVLRAGEGKKVRSLAGLVPLVNELEPEVSAMSDEELAHMTVAFRERVDQGEDLNDLLVEAFAVVREAARRTIGQRHYDVQLMGGMALHFGWIAEMRTGEGKTLVSTLPVYLNALSGKGVHVVTVNDYLARRDAEWMGRVYRFLGLEVGLVVPDVDTPDAKRAAYAADITYGTNTEFGFDYLRDNMAVERDQMVQRGHSFAIVDEVDSILIDEARTPLIISGPSDESTRLYYQFASVVRTLKRDEDYEVDEEKRTVVPTEDGIAKVERQISVENLYDAVAVNYVHQLGKALEAKELYHRDKEYIVADGEVKIVDEFTGRILEGRRWSDGLHQAVEAKERVRIKEENHTWATVTLQNYFRMYEKLAGMTGTAETEAAEFASTYDLQVVPIPTNRPMVRDDGADLVFKTEEGKFKAVVEDIAERFETGQPVLVGTASVEKSEHLSRLLDKQGIPHTVLNAKQHTREAQIVAQAGRLHGVTVATNMAGRGVDILLGGNPGGLAQDAVLAEGLDPETDEGAARGAELLAKFSAECAAEADQVRELGGLYVLGSERHESRRIDNQLRGRSGRQGDPGESRFFLSLEDELMRLFASGAMSWVMDRALPEDVPIEARMVSRAIERAQNTVEARNAEVRKDVLKYDEVMNEQRKVIYERRLQILDGEDLRERTLDLLETTLERVVTTACPNDFAEEWDLERLVNELAQYYPTEFTVEDLEQADTVEQLVESVLADAVEHYEQREQTMPGGEEMARQVERQIMMQIIDQRWRQHLSEMDYLREGIHLRGIAQTDPLVAWQREGFELFGKLMDSIDDDYLRYVMHVQLLVEQEVAPDYTQASFEAADDPASGLATAAGFEPAADESVEGAGAAQRLAAPPRPAAAPDAPRPARPANVSRSAGAELAGARAPDPKLGRNDPCWCGSGKKFKLCHGAA
ncbi:MAG: preprotein translocase, SecA subunit [Acidimicrobiaceae bacterium]|nr:preprotein translocase, SecA subunit [Acidimicrobiaceae bacterium]